MIHIATCFDQNFEVPFSVLACSIEAHSRSNVTIHAVHNGPIEYARATAQNLKKLNVVFYDGSDFLGKYRAVGTQTVTTFLRLHLHQLLHGVTRIIYLDTDVIVRSDLGALFNVDLKLKPIAAAIDYPLLLMAERGEYIHLQGMRWKADAYILRYLGMKNIGAYFNAGVLVIDLRNLEISGALTRADRFLVQKDYRCKFNEQDALNVALEDNYEVLDPRWNFMPNVMPQLGNLANRTRLTQQIRTVLKLCEDPWIIHFAGQKPWKGKGRSGRWERFFLESLFGSRPLDAAIIERLMIGLVQEKERAHATREAILRSPSQLAKAWWRAVRWKLGIRRPPE
jgi:lipopolysaccharide biosynthesis glycosyltransferase